LIDFSYGSDISKIDIAMTLHSYLHR